MPADHFLIVTIHDNRVRRHLALHFDHYTTRQQRRFVDSAREIGSFTDITNGWLRGSQAALDPARTLRDPRSGQVIRPYHRHDATTLLTPGTSVDVAVELWQTGTQVPAGSSLRVLVTAEDAPWTVPNASTEAGQVLSGSLVLPTLP